ncbi:MAG TPA: GTPase Era, partial [Bacteroidota bacterium]|nr:GTPase Era [Bacteroidota bacterium]
DTPGLLTPRYLLHKVMMNSASSAITDADLILFMIDASAVGINKENHHPVGVDILKNIRKNVYLIINKSDLSNGGNIHSIITCFSKEFTFKEIIPISALQRIGIEELMMSIVNELPEHPPFYPVDFVSERSERFFVSEIIREKIIDKFRDEIPYSVAVEIIEFKEREGRKDFISAEIYVERQSQKGILIGKSGKALKDIGELARKDIESFLSRPVYLELHVKVRINWKEKEQWLRRFGYYES